MTYRSEAAVRTCAVRVKLEVPEIGSDGEERVDEACGRPTEILCVACGRSVCHRHLAAEEPWCTECYAAFRQQLGELATPLVDARGFRRLRLHGLAGFALAIALLGVLDDLFPGSAIIYLAAIPQVFGIDRLHRARDEARRRGLVAAERRRFLAARAGARILAPGG